MNNVSAAFDTSVHVPKRRCAHPPGCCATRQPLALALGPSSAVRGHEGHGGGLNAAPPPPHPISPRPPLPPPRSNRDTSLCGLPVIDPYHWLVNLWTRLVFVFDMSYTAFLVPVSVGFQTSERHSWNAIIDTVAGGRYVSDSGMRSAGGNAPLVS